MFRMIRCGSDYDPVIVVSPPDADPGSAGAQYYRWSTWGPGELRAFQQITERTADSYFGGQADGLGFEELPDKTFASLEEADTFILEQRGEVGPGQQGGKMRGY